MSEETYKVVIYARVSTDDKGQTNETQIREVKAYCNRMGWTVAEIYTDEQTGKNDKRPGFRSLKGRITEGDIDYVVARNQDRISREPKDYQEFLAFCDKFRVRLRYSDNSSQPETASGVLLDSVQSGIAKVENIKKSTATKGGMLTAKLEGRHVGRMLRFCWSDEVIENASRIQMTVDEEHKYKTVIATKDTVLGLADEGYSIPKAAKWVLEIGTSTLKRALIAKGIMNEYQERYKAARGKNRPQGLSTKRVENEGLESTKRVDTEIDQKGTLMGDTPTLMGDSEEDDLISCEKRNE